MLLQLLQPALRQGPCPPMSPPNSTDRGGPDYVVVARRYRPQTFDELIGQQHVAQALQRAISSDRVGHAYLFTGARGVGKTSAARILAKALNCERGPSPTPCNQCEICDSIGAGDDVDVLEIDGASNRGIDEIRQLRQNVAVRPSRARLKIYIIDEVHMLTKEAFNALLKTLEEPPEHVKFIFATTEANKIPITILSRCQRFDFAGIEPAAIQTRLEQIAAAEGVQIETDALQILSMRAAGSMRDSQSLLEQLLSGGGETITADDVTEMLGIAPAARLSQLVAPLVNHDAAAALDQLDAALADGADVSQLVDQLLGYVRDVMTQSVGCNESQLLYTLPSQREEIRTYAAQLGVQTLLAIAQVLDQASQRMRLSTHGRILAEMAVVRICNLENLDELADLLAQLRGTATAANVSGGLLKKNVGIERRSDAPPRSSPQGAPALAGSARIEPEPPVSRPSEQEIAVATAVRSATQLTNANAEQVWKQALDSLTGTLADHAAQADEVLVDERGRLVLEFSNEFDHQRCDRPANRSQLEEAVGRVCGESIPLEMRYKKRKEAAAPAPVTSWRQQQAELVAQPFVKTALELFDGDPQKLKFVPPPG